MNQSICLYQSTRNSIWWILVVDNPIILVVNNPPFETNNLKTMTVARAKDVATVAAKKRQPVLRSFPQCGRPWIQWQHLKCLAKRNWAAEGKDALKPPVHRYLIGITWIWCLTTQSKTPENTQFVGQAKGAGQGDNGHEVEGEDHGTVEAQVFWTSFWSEISIFWRWA